MPAAILPLLLGAVLLVLVRRLVRDARTRRAARAGYLDLVGLQDRRKMLAATGFARVSGRVSGLALDLQAVPDSLTFRKLPVLWLLVTVPEPLPLRQRIDLLVRPSGIEPFSDIDHLPCQSALPPGFPPHAALRSEHPLTGSEAALLERHRGMFGDPRVKELVLSPRGLRITWLAEEADRGRYLLFRDAELGRTALEPAVLQPLLDRLGVLRRDIMAGSA